MVIKSLTITEDAYNALKSVKYGDESFSDVVLRLSKEKIGAAARFAGALKMSETETRQWKEKVRKRREDMNLEFVQRSKKMRERL
ncbi:antitoxin VapB family protein [Candidatus Woesearchaeota archaeon]|nr:antitoxin VapB family protein [Candidatus Woesearchaeota archaeon]